MRAVSVDNLQTTLEITKMLLDKGADKSAKNQDKKAILKHAKRPEIVKLLVKCFLYFSRQVFDSRKMFCCCVHKHSTKQRWN